MNEKIKALEQRCWSHRVDGVLVDGHLHFDTKKFAELIVRECMKESMDEIVADEDLATETDPLIREYLLGNNQGIVDAVVRFRNHFGVEE
jgi:hypothetical protein